MASKNTTAYNIQWPFRWRCSSDLMADQTPSISTSLLLNVKYHENHLLDSKTISLTNLDIKDRCFKTAPND